MKPFATVMLGALVSACAGAPMGPPATASHDVAAAPARPDTVVARNHDCPVVVRARDGRPVCRYRPAPAGAGASAVVPASAAVATTDAAPPLPPRLAPGRYVVIGSFAERANAQRWADYNDAFGTTVQVVEHGEPVFYRVLVGPLHDADPGLMREILAAAGAGRGWPLEVCAEPLPGMAAGCGALGETGLADNARP